jgi:hypothetical protein
MPRIIVNPDTPNQWEFQLNDGVCVVGRAADCDLVLDHQSIAERHAEIHVFANQVSLLASGKETSILIAGKPLEQADIKAGTRFSLGDVELQLLPDEKAPRADFLAADVPRIQKPLQEKDAPQAADQGGSIIAALVGAFSYPLSSEGLYILAGGAIFFTICDFLPTFVGILSLIVSATLTALLVTIAGSIIQETAQDKNTLPGWPDISNWLEDILQPVLCYVLTLMISFGPAIYFARQVFQQSAPMAPLIFACAWGCLTFPILVIAVALTDSISAAVNPIPLVRAVLLAPAHYLCICIFFALIVSVGFGIGVLERWAGRIPILPHLAAWGANLYFICVLMRGFGLFYRLNHHRIQWYANL